MDLQQGLNNAWTGVASFVPKLVGAIVIFIIGWIVAKVLAKLCAKVLSRVGFDRAVERGGLGRMLRGSAYEPSNILAKIVYWAVLLFTLQFAFGVFGANPISDLLSGIIAYLPNVFVAVVIMVIAGWLASVARDLVGNFLSGLTYGRTVATAVWVAVLVFGAFAAINQLRIAPAIVNALWWAVLTAAVGTTVVAVGGGGIPVMRRYLERAGSQPGGGAATAGAGRASPDRANVGTYQEEPAPATAGPGAEQAAGDTWEERAGAEETRAGYEPRHAAPGTHDEVRPEDVTGEPRDEVGRETR